MIASVSLKGREKQVISLAIDNVIQFPHAFCVYQKGHVSGFLLKMEVCNCEIQVKSCICRKVITFLRHACLPLFVIALLARKCEECESKSIYKCLVLYFSAWASCLTNRPIDFPCVFRWLFGYLWIIIVTVIIWTVNGRIGECKQTLVLYCYSKTIVYAA